jgi:hypothetical protein
VVVLVLMNKIVAICMFSFFSDSFIADVLVMVSALGDFANVSSIEFVEIAKSM